MSCLKIKKKIKILLKLFTAFTFIYEEMNERERGGGRERKTYVGIDIDI